MGLDFQEGVENAAKVKVFADHVVAFAKSLKRAEGQPAPAISYITDGIADLVKEAGRLAESVQVDLKD